ncbi:hypothetical protein APR08_003468 [Nocardia amikacinitolerans]|nr:hypothetical protein [Nocardia amikacinitolerans]
MGWGGRGVGGEARWGGGPGVGVGVVFVLLEPALPFFEAASVRVLRFVLGRRGFGVVARIWLSGAGLRPGWVIGEWLPWFGAGRLVRRGGAFLRPGGLVGGGSAVLRTGGRAVVGAAGCRSSVARARLVARCGGSVIDAVELGAGSRRRCGRRGRLCCPATGLGIPGERALRRGGRRRCGRRVVGRRGVQNSNVPVSGQAPVWLRACAQPAASRQVTWIASVFV